MPTVEEIKELELGTGAVITADWYTKLVDALLEFRSEIDTLPAGLTGRAFSGLAKTVTETVLTLKDECTPTADKTVIYPLNIVIEFSNPSGSLVTLYVEVRLLHSDDTETTVDSFSVAEAVSGKNDYTSEFIAKAIKDNISVIGVRLYAYCSATPATGYEPSVTLTSVKAFQF